MLRREKDDNCRVAFTWTPEGKKRRGRPKTTQRSTIEREQKELGLTTWNVEEQVAKDREEWKLSPGLTLHLRSEEDE